MNVYPLNQIVVCQFTFEDSDGVVVDPAAAAVTVTDPDGVESSYTLAQLTRLSTGVYTLDVTGSKLGHWKYEASGDGGRQVGASYFRIVET